MSDQAIIERQDAIYLAGQGRAWERQNELDALRRENAYLQRCLEIVDILLAQFGEAEDKAVLELRQANADHIASLKKPA